MIANKKPMIAGVFQGHFATVQAPQKSFSHIGTAGLAPCVGVAFISFPATQAPIITVAHFDRLNTVLSSLEAMRRDHPKGVSTAYVESGEGKAQLEAIVAVLRAWGLSPLINQIKPEKQGDQDWAARAMIFDLMTGLPVDNEKFYAPWKNCGRKSRQQATPHRPLSRSFCPRRAPNSG